MLKEVPAGPGKKQFVGQIVTACSHWSPLPLCELTPEDWQLALAAPVTHLDRHVPTMLVLSDVGFEPPPPSDQGALQSEGPAVSTLLLGWCSPEHDGCDLHETKGIGGSAVASCQLYQHIAKNPYSTPNQSCILTKHMVGWFCLPPTFPACGTF
jgi:hypothetical protein